MAEESEGTNANNATQLKFSDVVFTTLKRWPWIILSLAICLGLATLYLLRTQPVYTRTASIVIKDDSKGSSVNGDLNAFSDMGFLNNRTNIDDEVNTLQSPDVMAEVVKRLNLNVGYTREGRFHREIVYGADLPVAMTFPNMLENTSFSAVVDVDKQGRYTLSDIESGRDDVELINKGPVALGDTVKTTVGPVVVAATPYYKKGEEVTLRVTRTPMHEAVGAFAGKLNVAQKSDKGNTINLTVSDVSTQRAEDLINTVINVYNERWIENRNQISVSTSNFINDRLAMIENELGHVDQDISSYQSEHLIPDVQQAASMYMSENQAVSAQILDLGNQLQMTRYMRSYLADGNSRNKVLPANSGIGNTNIESQIDEYNNILLKRNQYADNSSATHPVVVDLDNQLAAMRSAILSSVDNQIVALQTQMRNLQGSKSRTTAQIAANPSQAKYLLSVERQQKVKEALYLFLLQKREENELSQAFTAYNTQVISRPGGSNFPTSPARNKILLVAFAAGLIIPFIVTYVLEVNNTKVRGRKDIEKIRLPFLGEIPTVKPVKGEDPNTRVVVKHGKRDIVNEAFRVIRTNMSFLAGKDKSCSVFMITSFNPGSGKTFITVNLAVSLAIRNKRVLVVDCDLRRGSTSAYVGSPHMGLSDYLVGVTDDINSVIVRDTIVKGLSVLPVGTIPPNPTELLESDRFPQLIRSLREEYDYILIDCPPIEIMADAQIIEQLVDRTIFVVRAGVMDRSMIPEIDRLAREKKYRNMSIVLNSTAADGARNRYGYAYGYGNYDKYASK